MKLCIQKFQEEEDFIGDVQVHWNQGGVSVVEMDAEHYCDFFDDLKELLKEERISFDASEPHSEADTYMTYFRPALDSENDMFIEMLHHPVKEKAYVETDAIRTILNQTKTYEELRNALEKEIKTDSIVQTLPSL